MIFESIIPQVNEVKFLGITIDSKLCWNGHTEEMYKRFKCAITVIKHITPCIHKENYKTLYHTLFESHISYGISEKMRNAVFISGWVLIVDQTRPRLPLNMTSRIISSYIFLSEVILC